MHLRLLYKKVLYVFLSLAIVITSTIQQANAASSWSISSAVSAGSRTIVTASKGGYKAAVNISPSAGRLALRVAKLGRGTALIYAVDKLLDGIDWVLEPENNRVRYNTVSPDRFYYLANEFVEVPLSEINRKHTEFCGTSPITPIVDNKNGSISLYCMYKSGSLRYNYKYPTSTKYLSMPQIAAQVSANAAAGHAPSKDVVKSTSIEMVVTGDFDKDLLSGAVPVSDTRPLVPAVPISGNGNVAVGDTDAGMTGGDVGKVAEDARKAADDARKAAQAAADVYKDAVEAARKAAEEAESVINSAVDQAIKDAAKAAAAAAAKSAADAKAVTDRAAQAALEAAKSSERAAQAAAQAAQGIADSAKSALEAAKSAADATTESIAQAQAVADTAAAAATKAMEAAKAAEKASEKAKAEAAKPFELPAFCTWASVVCDYTVWVKEEYGKAKDWVKEEPVVNPAELMPIDDDSGGLANIFQDKAEAGYVSFESACPSDVLIPIDLMGASQVLNISYAPFCHFASMIRYAVILGAWISGLLIVTGGRSRE